MNHIDFLGEKEEKKTFHFVKVKSESEDKTQISIRLAEKNSCVDLRNVLKTIRKVDD